MKTNERSRMAKKHYDRYRTTGWVTVKKGLQDDTNVWLNFTPEVNTTFTIPQKGMEKNWYPVYCEINANRKSIVGTLPTLPPLPCLAYYEEKGEKPIFTIPPLPTLPFLPSLTIKSLKDVVLYYIKDRHTDPVSIQQAISTYCHRTGKSEEDAETEYKKDKETGDLVEVKSGWVTLFKTPNEVDC
jgi:hypothetical protein